MTVDRKHKNGYKKGAQQGIAPKDMSIVITSYK